MHNLLKMKAVSVFGAVFAMLAAPAAAQSASNTLPGSSAVMNAIGATDALAMLEELELTGELHGNGVDDPFILAKTPGGGQFLLRFFGCDDATLAAGCASVVVNTAFSNAGATYDELNAFNANSTVTTAINSPENQLIIFGRHIIVQGGVTKDHFELELALFLLDMQAFADARTSAGTAVSLDLESMRKSKIDGLTALSDAPPLPVMTSKGLAAETSVAVVNLWSAEFVTDAARALAD